MLNGYVITISIIATSLILLGLAVFLRNPKPTINKLFLFFSSTAALWLITNHLAGDKHSTKTVALIANHLVFFFAIVGSLAILSFILALTKRSLGIIKNPLFVVNIIAVAGSFSPFIIKSVFLTSDTYSIRFGILAPVYFFALAMNAAVLFYNLLAARKNATGSLNAQLNVISASFIFSFIGIIATNAVLPFFFSYYGLTNSSSFFTLTLVFGIGYAIVKHKLFDVRLLVARSLAYVLSIGLLVVSFGFTTYVISNSVAEVTKSVKFTQIVDTLFVVAAVIVYAPVKKFFDKSTRRIFYRDAYDPQVFLDTLNGVMVANIELEKLLTDVVQVISVNLKASFCVFSIRETSYFPRRVIGDEKKIFSEEDIKDINTSAPRMHKKVIETDSLDEDSELKRVLEKNDIAILVRLVSTLDYEIEGTGYVLFGSKKSGNPYSKADVRILDIIANELVIAVQNGLRFEEIEKFNATLEKKVDDATNKLRKSNEKLKTLDETKDEFISMASHQLRTPLTSVKGYLSMVLEGDAGALTEMQHKLLDQAFISSQRMVYLIADLLNVSRLRTGKFIIEAAPSNLAEVIEGEVGQLKATAASRKLSLTFNKPENFPTLMLDETKIRQVIMNFMDNAIYYTPAGGHITVELKETDQTVEYTVNDDGMGVPRSEQHHLFTKFYRAGNAKKARPDGTGLGLFMSKKVIVAQGGNLIFRSQENKGSTFGFSFEKAKLLPNPAISN